MKRKAERNNKNNFLNYIPRIKHNNYKVENDIVKLVFQHNGPVERIVQFIFKKPRVTDLSFDELGSTAWLYIDGKRSVMEIGKLMCENNQQNEVTIYKQLSIFFSYLYRQKWISFIKQEEKDVEGAA